MAEPDPAAASERYRRAFALFAAVEGVIVAAAVVCAWAGFVRRLAWGEGALFACIAAGFAVQIVFILVVLRRPRPPGGEGG
jgi:hypothetical protein